MSYMHYFVSRSYEHVHFGTSYLVADNHTQIQMDKYFANNKFLNLKSSNFKLMVSDTWGNSINQT